MEKTYTPVDIRLPIGVTLKVGERSKPLSPDTGFVHRIPLQDRTVSIRWHETVVDIFLKLSIPTDGTQVMLIPGTPFPFQMEDRPYEDIRSGVVLSVVPNRPDQVGDNAQPSANLPTLPKPKVAAQSAESVDKNDVLPTKADVLPTKVPPAKELSAPGSIATPEGKELSGPEQQKIAAEHREITANFAPSPVDTAT